jgi:glucose uptake protein GlcU
MWLDGCGDECGWIAAVIAAVTYGSFGVPICSTKHIDVHPLVMQSYKTMTLFLLSWTVVWLGVPVRFTIRWGFLSGLLWVMGGTGGVYAIRLAGLAVAVGTWASVMIAVNFFWGILIFHEPVAHFGATLAAFALLALGLVGMSVYSAPTTSSLPASDDPIGSNTATPLATTMVTSTETTSIRSTGNPLYKDEEHSTNHTDAPFSLFVDHQHPTHNMDNTSSHNKQDEDSTTHLSTIDTVSFTICRREFVLSKRLAGISGAVFNGIMTGSSLIPMHYAKKNGFGGAHYMLSLGLGSLLANILIWILYYLYHVGRLHYAQTNTSVSALSISSSSNLPCHTLWTQAYFYLPPWHVAQIAWPGMCAGTLLTIAMFGSILAVTYLGQGIGNSVVQSKILISGLWGILWFREIQGCRTIALWMLSATCTIVGIIGLCQERLLATRSQQNNQDGNND